MHRRARAIGLALTSATLLAGTVLTAAPASAAPAGSLTAASCQAQGGTFTQAKGVKTCTRLFAIRQQVTNTAQPTTEYAPYKVSQDVIDLAQLTAPGYQGDYSLQTPVQDSIVQTQKGGGQIVTTTATNQVGPTVITVETCSSAVRLVDGSLSFVGAAYIVQCRALGMYPENLYAYVGG
jgi:hypothetical protein